MGNVIIISERKVRRNSDGEILIPIIPDPSIGYYSSLMKLKSEGHNIEKYCDKETIDLNPTRFTYIDEK